MSATPTLRIRLVLATAGIGLVGSLLTGCATGTSALTADTAAGLQDGVLTVSEAAANGDFAGAQSALATVQADLTAASTGDGVTDARAAEIQAAIDLVATDLAAALAAGTPAETPDEAPVQTPAETEAPTPNETPEATPTEMPEDTEEPVVTDEPEPEETTPAPAPEPEKPAKDKSDSGACLKKDKCE